MAISSAYSSALAVGDWSGQPGNTVPIMGPASSDVLSLDYGLMAGFHRPVKKLTYSAAGITVGSSLSGALCYYDGPAATAGSGFIFTLPDPQPGLWFEFAGIGTAGTSEVTLFGVASATGAMLVAGDSGGADGVALSATTVDSFLRIEFVGISTANYIVTQKLCGSSLMVSTAAYIGVAASS
jgi:hypothetical protein